MIEPVTDRVDAAETAARASEASRGVQFSDAVQDAHDASPPHPGGIAGLWDDAVSGVSSAYHWTTDAVHTAGHAADSLAGKAIDAGTTAVRDVAGNGTANVVRGAAETLRNGVKQVDVFDVGVTEGAVEAVGGMGKGVGDLAGDAYRFATNGTFRGQVVHDAETLASHVAHDPVGTAKALGGAAVDAGKQWIQGAVPAAHDGNLGEYVGKGVGNAAVNIGGFFVPGVDAADGLNVSSKLGEAGEVLSDASSLSKLGRGAEVLDAARGADLAHAAGEAKPVEITLRGVDHAIPDWHMQEISYIKRTDKARDTLRAAFPPVRRAFVKDFVTNHAEELRAAGMSKYDIAMMAKGRVPEGYQVHHMLPLDDGGTNATDNLVLIRNEPDHKLITHYQSEQTQGMSAGATRRMEWPMPDRQPRVWPETPYGGAHPTSIERRASDVGS